MFLYRFWVFLDFVRGDRPWEVVFGRRGCKIRVPAPTRASLAGCSNSRYHNRFRMHIAKESAPSVGLPDHSMAAPHSEQACTRRRNSFQYNECIHSQGYPRGTYKDDSRATIGVRGGHAHFHFCLYFRNQTSFNICARILPCVC